MKKLFVILVTAFALNANAQKEGTLDYMDFRYGFKDVHFEDSISKFPEMKPLNGTKESDIIKYYRRASDSVKMGDYTVKITYCFYKDILFRVNINTEGYINSRGVLDIMKMQYGDPYQDNRLIEKYTWKGKRVRSIYSENSITHDSMILMFSTKVNERKEAEEKERQKNSKSGF